MKINNHLKITLSVFVIIGIIFAFVFCTKVIFDNYSNDIAENENVIFEDDKFDKLNIRLISAKLTVENGENFSVFTDGGFIKYSIRNNELSVIEKTHFNNNDSISVKLQIPDNYFFSDIKIENDAGDISIDKISGKKVNIRLGAGDLKTDYVEAEDNLVIRCSAGNISSDKIISKEKTRIKCGAGNLKIKAALYGETKLDCASGETEVILDGDRELYSFDIDRGAGEIILFGESVDDFKTDKTDNFIRIDGGAGNIVIR